MRAGFGAVELSYDYDWMRFRLSGLYATGDGDPYNNTEGGFDAIFENPIFGGADTSYWIRQTIPFAGGGRVLSIKGDRKSGVQGKRGYVRVEQGGGRIIKKKSKTNKTSNKIH